MKRYIDDILMIWTHTLDDLEHFLQELNAFHPTIKFTWEISNTSVVYLDLTIYKGPHFSKTSYLDITTHFKKTNTFQYLHFTSCHPRSTFTGIIKGEAICWVIANEKVIIYFIV